MMDRLADFLHDYSHAGVFFALLATGLGVPIPEDIILVTAGVISAKHDSLIVMNLIGMSGVLGGDLIIYGLGYHYGNRILRHRLFSRLVKPARIRKARAYYRKYGYWAIFVSRFLAGLRATSFLLAGLSHVPPRVFLLADGAAALLSVPLLITLGHYFSNDIQALLGRIKEVQLDLMMGLVLVAFGILAYRWKKGHKLIGNVELPDDEEGDDDTHRP